jgi:hypothetical protein
MKVKEMDIYEVNGGQKVLLLTVEPTLPEVTEEELEESINQILEMFYSYDKVKLANKKGQGFVVRGGENKTFVIEAKISKE